MKFREIYRDERSANSIFSTKIQLFISFEL